MLIGAFGYDYANWTGAEIIIYRGETRFGGQRVASVEIEASNGSGAPRLCTTTRRTGRTRMTSRSKRRPTAYRAFSRALQTLSFQL